MTYEVENLSVVASEALAYCTSINHVNGMTNAGTTINMRWRATICYQKKDKQWLITHEHSSVPFDPKSGQALMYLKP
ncbi:YybH family protein [Spirosoma endophyticum]|uniref:SnoaL-like domain-containing protein n=1 Tax=Spirosoma endophyticum TaxID=662367 RepID=A0A1I2HVM9_9BACT|nr:nuclear transport factor 2 family protein [Spirosoma endophyticum]SFF33882.1 SnoaL-like domain-containing protein [Spirosoma endophyticum]